MDGFRVGVALSPFQIAHEEDGEHHELFLVSRVDPNSSASIAGMKRVGSHRKESDTPPNCRVS